jgi:hypothetical protein
MWPYLRLIWLEKTLLPLICWTTLALLATSAAYAIPLGTGFTYQGQLNQSGSPVSGTAHLRFSLWDEAGSGVPPVGGNQIGASQLLANVPVTGGLFTVQLNGGGQFGPSAFNGDARWLQIEVCADPGCGGTPTVLSPRQPLTGTPYSLGPWQMIGNHLSFSGANVGIGTAYTPQAKLHVVGGDLLVGAPGEEWIFHTRSLAGGDFLHITDLDSGTPQFQHGLVVAQNGNVGIGFGATAPAAELDVRGDIKLGTSGQYFAPAGEENLRIVRGFVTHDGSAPIGCCFTANRVSTGEYVVTLATPFSGIAIVTATPQSRGVYASVEGNTSSAFTVRMYSSSGNDTNIGFSFIAVGPR